MADTTFPAQFTAHCPNGPTDCCDEHARMIRGLFAFMGAHVNFTRAPEGAECANCANEAKNRRATDGVPTSPATEEAAFQRGKRRGYTDGYYAAEVAARPVLQEALDMLRTERYGNTDPDKRERTIERIERFIKGAPSVSALSAEAQRKGNA